MPMATSMMPRPIESGGKMKWKLAVTANWMRDSSRASIPLLAHPHLIPHTDCARAFGSRFETCPANHSGVGIAEDRRSPARILGRFFRDPPCDM